MKVTSYITSFLLCLSITVQGQIFSQSFDYGGAIGSYVNLTDPDENQFNLISNYPNFARSFKEGKLTFKKTGSASVNIIRGTDLGQEVKAAKISFKMKAWGQKSGRSTIFTHGKFLVGENFDPTSTRYPSDEDVSCSFMFNFPLVRGEDQFKGFKIGDPGSLNSVFSNEQNVSLVVNVTGKPVEYKSPSGTTMVLANERYDLWVGGIKVFADAIVKNPKVALKNIKLLIVPQAPDGLELSFDDFEITKLN